MFSLDVENLQENGKFVTTVYCKPTFSGVYINFESFLPSNHKFGMFYTLVYRCFTLCSDWIKFHRELVTLKQLSQRNDYLTSFIDKCYKKFLGRLHMIKLILATVENKLLRLVLPSLGSISLQVRTEIRNAMKDTLNCSKL